jgi:lipoate synthase
MGIKASVEGVKELYKGFSGEEKVMRAAYDKTGGDVGTANEVTQLMLAKEKVLITRLAVYVKTAGTGATGATINVGHTDNDDEFVKTIAFEDVAVDTVLALTLGQFILPAGKYITVTPKTANITAGKVIVEVFYKDVA